MPDFSIVTPVLNQASTIEACINSVAAQNETVEHIIIDGGSTDGTVDVIKQHEHNLAYWISEKDSGQSEAINKGLSHSNGTFFNWINADDKLTPDALRTVKDCIRKNTKVVVGECLHINENSEELAKGSAKIGNSLEATLGNYSMGQPSVFYRTECIKQLGGLNNMLHLCLDMDLWFRFLLRFGQIDIAKTDQNLSHFLVHSAAKSSRLQEEMSAEKYGIYKAVMSNVKLPEILDSFFENFEIPTTVSYRLPSNFNFKVHLANFSWHLLVRSYEENDYSSCKQFLSILNDGNYLSKSELLKWEARLISLRIRNK